MPFLHDNTILPCARSVTSGLSGTPTNEANLDLRTAQDRRYIMLYATCHAGQNVISWDIWSHQKLYEGFLLDLSYLQDSRTLGYMLIFGLYLKPTFPCRVYCS